MEFDVQLTKDLEPVIYHDFMISLNVALVSCYGILFRAGYSHLSTYKGS